MPIKGSGKGVRVNPKGYLQIIRRGEWCWWLEHRKVMLEACREFCYYHTNGDLPGGLTVEHLDHRRTHNCIENLMLLDKRIHDHISTAYRWQRYRRDMERLEEELRLERETPPDWVTDMGGEPGGDGGGDGE